VEDKDKAMLPTKNLSLEKVISRDECLCQSFFPSFMVEIRKAS
jgi:hypothetical protein